MEAGKGHKKKVLSIIVFNDKITFKKLKCNIFQADKIFKFMKIFYAEDNQKVHA